MFIAIDIEFDIEMNNRALYIRGGGNKINTGFHKSSKLIIID